jgi:hypothetical protein
MYIPLVGICLADLFFVFQFLWPGRSLRHWHQKATMLAGLCGLAWVGLTWYGMNHMQFQCSASVPFYYAKGLAAGMVIGALLVLLLSGWPKTVKEPAKDAPSGETPSVPAT